jgi:serine/threonine-protein kinase
MSRIFLARERALDRYVVVKVLPPELGDGLSLERFAREARLASRLVHPCIVPVLTVGAVDGLPYYVMPYVRGDSLRHALAAGRLPLSLVTRVLHDVLRAVAYAHREGVMHRDIKPGNVLVAGDGALVTDFGIARAIETGRTGERGCDAERGLTGATLTSTGVVIGTPGYMAPEQLLGDPKADHRVDLYAVGALAYELLTGHAPFAGLSSGALLTALFAGPPSVRTLRPEAPEALAALIDRCLAPNADDRPSTADEALASLDAVLAAAGHAPASPPGANGAAAPAGAPVRRRTRRRLAGAVAAVALLAGGLVAWPSLAAVLPTVRVLATRDAPTLAPRRLVVAPFEDATGDPALASLGDLVADQLAEALTRVPGLEVVDARTANASSEVVRRIPWPLRARDPGRALADETGAGLVLRGTIRREGDSLRARATIVEVTSGRVRQTLAAMAAPAATPTRLAEVVVRRVMASIAQGSDTVLQFAFGAVSPPPSLAAYRAMREGLRAYLAMDPRAREVMRRATTVDTGYVTPLVLLALFDATGGDPRAEFTPNDSALRELAPRLDLLSPAEAAVVEVARALLRHDLSAALIAAEELVRRTPGSAEAPLLVATLANRARQPRRALAALAQTDPDRGLNIGSPYFFVYRAEAWRLLGNHAQALADLREVERRFPTAAPYAAHGIAAILAEEGHTEEAATHVDALARQRDGDYPYVDELVAVARHARHGGTADRILAPLLPAAAAAAASPTELTAPPRWGQMTTLAVLAAAGRWIDVRRLVLHGRATLAVRRGPGQAHLWDRRALTFLHAAAANLRDTVLTAQVDRALADDAPEPPGSRAVRRAVLAAAFGRLDEAVRWLGTAREQGYGLTEDDGERFDREIALAPLFGYPPFEQLLETRDAAPRLP